MLRDVFLDQPSSLLPTRVSPVDAWRVKTTPLVRHRYRPSVATLAVSGPSLQRSSALMCADNSRFHSNCVWADRPYEERERVLSGYTANPPVRETRSNSENIVRAVVPPPGRVGGQAASSVENWLLFRDQTQAWR